MMTGPADRVLAANPYVGPRTFEEKDRHLFFGREREARALLSLVIAEPLVLFYAQSGAGKSSLLNTRLIPRLRQEEFTVLPTARVGGALPEGIESVDNVFVFNLLLSLDQGQRDAGELARMTLAEYLEGQARSENGSNTSRVLIVDQFEEIVTTYPSHWNERAGFFQQLNTALVQDEHLWVVLTMREDHIAALDPFAGLCTDRLRARFYMQRMEAAAALQAVREPAAAGGRPFAPGVAEALIDNLRRIHAQGGESHLGQFVEPVQLQVVCYQLWHNLKGRPSASITQQDVDELGDVDTALAQFYEQAVANVLQQTKTPELQLRNWFERYLITEAGTRGTVYQGINETAGLDNRVVQLLANQYLLRAEIRAGGTWYELVHDRFVTPILRANQAWRLQQSPVVRAAEAWERSGRNRNKLLQDAPLKEALATINRDTAEPLVQQFLATSEAAQSQRDLAEVQAMAAEQASHAENEARAARQMQAIRRALSIVFAIGLIIALVALSMYAWASLNASSAAAANSTASAGLMAAQATSTRAIEEQSAAEATSTSALVQREESAREAVLQAATAEAANSRVAEQREAIAAASTRAVEQQATAVAASNIAQSQEATAEAARRQTEAQRQQLLVKSLTFQALTVIESLNDAELATLLLLEANNIRKELLAGGDLNTDQEMQRTIETAMLPMIGERYFSTTLHGHTDRVNLLAFTDDGNTLISASLDGTVRQWALDTPGLEPRVILRNEDPVELMAITPDGQFLATADNSGNVKVWHLDNPGDPLYSLDAGPLIRSIAISSDGQTLAVSTDRTVQLWFLNESSPLRVTLFQVNPDGFDSLIFAPGGRTLYARAPSESRHNVYSWNLDDEALTANGDYPHLPVAYSPDERLVAYASVNPDDFADPSAFPVSYAAQPFSFFRTEQSQLLGKHVSFAPDNRLLADSDGSAIRLWQLDLLMEGRYNVVPLARLTGHTGAVTALRFSPDGQTLASASVNGTIRLWRPSAATTAFPGSVSAVAFSPVDSQTVMVANASSIQLQTLQIEPTSITTTASLPLGSSGASVVAFSPDGQHVATSGAGLNDIYLWQGDDLNVAPLILSGHSQPVRALTFSADGQWLVSGSGQGERSSNDDTVRLWNLRDRGAPPIILDSHQAQVNSVAFSRDAQMLVSASSDGSVLLWHVDNPGAPVEIEVSESEVTLAVAFSPDGQWLVMGTASRQGAEAKIGNLRLWHSESLDARPIILGEHSGQVNALAISPDSRLLASAGSDNTVRLWQLDALVAPPIVLTGYESPVVSLSFAADGRLLASAGADGLRLWSMPGRLLEAGCAQVRRNLSWEEWQTYLKDEPYRQTCPDLPAHYTVSSE